MTAKQRERKAAAYRAAMAGLIQDQRFHDFMDTVKEQRDFVVDDVCTDRVIANERTTLIALGEVRFCNWLLAIRDDLMEAPPPEPPEGG